MVSASGVRGGCMPYRHSIMPKHQQFMFFTAAILMPKQFLKEIFFCHKSTFSRCDVHHKLETWANMYWKSIAFTIWYFYNMLPGLQVTCKYRYMVDTWYYHAVPQSWLDRWISACLIHSKKTKLPGTVEHTTLVGWKDINCWYIENHRNTKSTNRSQNDPKFTVSRTAAWPHGAWGQSVFLPG
jgi:hypothetical protein